MDLNGDGAIDVEASNLTFNLNNGSGLSYPGVDVHVPDDWTGFANPSVNDDIAIIKLSAAVPDGVPIYEIDRDPFEFIEPVTMVGYGLSGDGVNGYYVNPSWTDKRTGQNNTDVYRSDDDGGDAREVYQVDFDGPHHRTNLYGRSRDSFNLTLGNAIETTLGGGDSGGAALKLKIAGDPTSGLELFGINTFTFGAKAPAPLFGSGAGGTVVSAYADWIDGVLAGTSNAAPVVSISSPANSEEFSSGGSTVSFVGSASDAEDGDITSSLTWTSDIDGAIGTGGSGNFLTTDGSTLSDGTHVITASATDSGSNTGSDSITVTVGDPPATATGASVTSIDYVTEGGKDGNKHLSVTPFLDDNLGVDVSGASVSIRLENTDTGQAWTGTGTTGADGSTTFTLKNARSGIYVTTITNVVASGLNWDGITPGNEFTKTSSSGGGSSLFAAATQVFDARSELLAVHFSPQLGATASNQDFNVDNTPVRSAAIARRAERPTFSRAAVDASMKGMAETRSALRRLTASRRAPVELSGELEELISAIL